MPFRYFFLFLPMILLLSTKASGQDAYRFTPKLREAYEYLLQLNKDSARYALDNHQKADGGKGLKIYLEHLYELIPVFLQEKQSLYDAFHENYGQRLEKLRDIDQADPYQRYLKSEMKVHSALINFKFGYKFSAGWELRKAFKLLRRNQREYPGFTPDDKLLGLLNIVLGSVPDNYQWLLSILSMKGDVAEGKRLLRHAARTPHPFQLESKIYRQSLNTFMWENEESLDVWRDLQQDHSGNLLIRFVYCLALEKMHYTESALHFIQDDLFEQDHFFDIPHYQYIQGQLHLEAGGYDKAIMHLQQFLDAYKGINYVRSAHMKLAMAWWIKGDKARAREHMEKIKEKGQQLTDGDQYATQMAQKQELPPALLLQARLYSDGGYKTKALDALAEIDKSNLSSKHLLEYYYRKGRIYHQEEDIRKAVRWYRKVLNSEAPDDLPYYVPNAALQLGYIYQTREPAKARSYFRKVLEFDDYPYQSSIENKAKAALR